MIFSGKKGKVIIDDPLSYILKNRTLENALPIYGVSEFEKKIKYLPEMKWEFVLNPKLMNNMLVNDIFICGKIFIDTSLIIVQTFQYESNGL